MPGFATATNSGARPCTTMPSTSGSRRCPRTIRNWSLPSPMSSAARTGVQRRAWPQRCQQRRGIRYDWRGGKMKLFIVLYLAGKIVTVSDPVDWPEEECRQAIAEALKQTDFSILARYGYTADDVHADCEWHEKKPATYEEPQPDFRFIGDAG